MTADETLKALIYLNKWRRGDDETIDQPPPKEIGEAIDTACELIEQLIKIQTNQEK